MVAHVPCGSKQLFIPNPEEWQTILDIDDKARAELESKVQPTISRPDLHGELPKSEGSAATDSHRSGQPQGMAFAEVQYDVFVSPIVITRW